MLTTSVMQQYAAHTHTHTHFSFYSPPTTIKLTVWPSTWTRRRTK